MFNSPPVYVIAEAGVNHNGSIEMALGLVDAAAKAGADAVKFQTFKAEGLVSKHAEKAGYQKQTTDASQNQLEMLKRLELNGQDHQIIIEHCHHVGIHFMSSPFDHKSLDLLVNHFDIPQLKLGSGELTNAPLLLAVAQTGKQLILSTGMSTIAEIEKALSVLAFGYLGSRSTPGVDAFTQAFDCDEGKELLRNKVTLLHCTTEYPAPFDEVNLRALDTMADTFGLSIGYSDHTTGWMMSVAAVAKGARVIEKHFTLDRTLPGPDHLASLEPHELKEMVEAIRQVEKGLGDGKKQPVSSELGNMKVARKSLVALTSIREGECFTEDNLTVKRPGGGISPFYYWDYLKRRAERDYSEDEVI